MTAFASNDTGHAIIIRPCSGFTELDNCVDVQEQVWGYDERDIIPRRLFVVAQRVGGQVFGAFEAQTEKMIGFAMALPGVKGRTPYLHSHMLAVLPAWRNRSVGRRLKLAQRDDALSRGMSLMEWTFDPLEIKNAFLNVARLGAIVRSYSPNFYGPLHSELQAGLQSDRMHAEWWLGSGRVSAALSGQTDTSIPVEETIQVPHAVATWKSSAVDRAHAIQLQAENRTKFIRAFAQGLVVIGFKRDEQGNGIYELGKLAEVDANRAVALTAGSDRE